MPSGALTMIFRQLTFFDTQIIWIQKGLNSFRNGKAPNIFFCLISHLFMLETTFSLKRLFTAIIKLHISRVVIRFTLSLFSSITIFSHLSKMLCFSCSASFSLFLKSFSTSSISFSFSFSSFSMGLYSCWNFSRSIPIWQSITFSTVSF